MLEHFKNQIEREVDIYVYGVQRGQFDVSIRTHKGSLETFPKELEYVRQLTDDWPLFKEKQ